MPEVQVWEVFVSLGIPGLAFGVLYMLFRKFDWKLPALPRTWIGPVLVLFLLLTSAFAALILWSPNRQSVSLIDTKTITVDPDRIVGILLENKSHWPSQKLRFQGDQDQQLFDYLDYIADQADKLAKAWEDVFTELADSALDKRPTVLAKLREKYRVYKRPNAPYFAELFQFYQILQENGLLVGNWTNSLSTHLYGLLESREDVTLVFAHFTTSEEHPAFISKWE